MGGRESWPRTSLVSHGNRRGQRSKGRHLSPAEIAAIEADLRARGDLDPAPVLKVEEGK
jgi:hypothetical protein